MRLKKLSVLMVLALLLMLTSFSLSSVMAQDDIGSESNPIQVYFVPSVEAGVITTGGEVMAAALEEATGLSFDVLFPTSYAATVEAMCASPANSMGFIPAAGAVIANRRCGVNVAAAAVRRGWPVYWAAYIVRRDSGIHTFGDLAGRTWGYGDVSSTSGYIFPAVELGQAGVVPGESVVTGGHGQTVSAVYNGEVDFGTVFYSPPVVPGAPWQIGDLPEPYDLTVDESFVSDDGNLFVGDIQVLDARILVSGDTPDIVDVVKILRLSAAIPNDSLSFGPDFPAELQQQIMDALIAFSQTDGWAQSIGSEEFYGWSSIAVADNSDYEIVAGLFDVLGMTEEDIFNPGG